jgi:hypothetical protein
MAGTPATAGPAFGPPPALFGPGAGAGGLSGGLPGVAANVPAATQPSSGAVATTLGEAAVPGEAGIGSLTDSPAMPPLPGIASTGSIPGAPGAPLAGEVISAQPQPERDAALAGPDDKAPDDMAGLPLLDGGGAAGPRERQRPRHVWLLDDDLWQPSAPLVPPVIDNEK